MPLYAATAQPTVAVARTSSRPSIPVTVPVTRTWCRFAADPAIAQLSMELHSVFNWGADGAT